MEKGTHYTGTGKEEQRNLASLKEDRNVENHCNTGSMD